MPDETRRCPFCDELIRAQAVKCKHCGSTLGGQMGQGGEPGWQAGSLRIPPGTEIREYRVLELLGEGGMGEVYLAEHTYTGQRVALKAVSPALMQDQGARRRFLEEGRVMAGLEHPNIVALHAFFEEAGRFFLVMRYVAGKDLDQVIQASSERQQPISLGSVCKIAEDLAEGLAYAHEKEPPVIHRDIKPANVVVDKNRRAVITDYGIAKALDREKLTRTNGVVGTYEYMSPEQVTGAEVSPASDVYSAGIMIYCMLTGVVPFPQASPTGVEVMDGHRHSDPSPVQTHRPDCPDWLANLVHHCLEKDPADRYPNGRALLVALQTGSKIPTEIEVVPTPVAVTYSRNRWYLPLAIGTFGLVLALALFLLRPWHGDRPEESSQLARSKNTETHVQRTSEDREAAFPPLAAEEVVEERDSKKAERKAVQKTAFKKMDVVTADRETTGGASAARRVAKTEPAIKSTEEVVEKPPTKMKSTRPSGGKAPAGSPAKKASARSGTKRAAGKSAGGTDGKKTKQMAAESKAIEESVITEVALKMAKEHFEHGMLLRNRSDFSGALRYFALARNGGMSAQVVDEAVGKTLQMKMEAEEQAAEAESARKETAARLGALKKAEEHFRYAEQLRREGDFNGARSHLALSKSGGVPAPVVNEAVELVYREEKEAERRAAMESLRAAEDSPGQLTFRKVRIPADTTANTGIDETPEPTRKTLSVSDLVSVVRKNKPRLTRCFNKYGSGLDLARISVHVTIEGSGSVTSVSIATREFAGTALGQCAKTEISKMQFPAFSGESVVKSIAFVLP